MIARASVILLAVLQVCALHVTERARSRILKAGGSIMTFDQLALKAPKGQGTVLMQGENNCSKSRADPSSWG